MKHRIRIVFALLLGVAAMFGAPYPIYCQPTSQIPAYTHPVIANDQQRLKLIDDIWNALDKELKNRANGYLSNNRLTDAGRAFIKKSVPVLMTKKVFGK